MSRPLIIDVPPVSVVMPVFDGEPYLAEAIDSLLGQTAGDLELVIIENGSTDGSRDVVRAAAARDERVRLLKFDRPLGFVGAANVGVAAARSELVARQDQDDLSHPRRLERQLEVLDASPRAVAVGTLYEGIDASGRRRRGRDRWPLVGRSPLPPFPHGSVCFRREAFQLAGGYREGTYNWEDVDLFLRLARFGPILVVPEALYRYRFHCRSSTALLHASRDDGAALMWRCIEEHRRGRDWDHLLGDRGAAAPAATARRTAARAQRHRDGVLLWSGARAPAPPDPYRPSGLALRARRAWHRASPGTLRLALSAGIRLRDIVATPLLRGRDTVEWRSG